MDGLKAILGKKSVGKIDGKIGGIIKAILKMGAGLSKAKEFEDIFEDVEEEIASVLFKAQFSSEEEINALFKKLKSEAGVCLKKVSHPDKANVDWQRFLDGIYGCTMRMVASLVQKHNAKNT